MNETTRRQIDLLAEMVGAYRAALEKHGFTGELQITLLKTWYDSYLAALVAPTNSYPRPIPLPDVEDIDEA